MIELAKGNIDSLEGRVLIYGKFQNGGGEPAIMAAYASTDPIDFAERIGADPSYVQQKMDKRVQEFSGQLASRGIDSHVKGVNVAVFPLSEDDIKTYDCDILYVRDWNCIANCHNIIMSSLNIYFSRYVEQLAKKHRINPAEVHESLVKYNPNDKSVDLKALIYKRFVCPMYSSRDHDKARFEDLRQELIAYSKGSPIFNEVLALCQAIEAQAPAGVIELTIEKIDAIHREDYTRAAEIRDELKLK